MSLKINRSQLLDSGNRPLTQSLFLELGYSDQAIYTLKDEDHEYKGKIYHSLKKLYMAEEDPTEYEFANKYFLNYRHWMRICDNKQFTPYIKEWREEVELRIASQAFRDMVALSASEGGNFSATKWLADKGWNKRQAGRPSKAEKEQQIAFETRVVEEFTKDIDRLTKLTRVS